MYYHLIAPVIVVRDSETAFTYASETKLPIGSLVRISIGKRQCNAVVIDTVPKPAFETKLVLEVLAETPLPRPLIELAHWMSEYYATHLAVVFQTLLPAGLHKNRRAAKTNHPRAIRDRTTILLNDEQVAAIKEITEHRNGTVLLHGVPGSGKTQVYIESAKQATTAGKSSIILVPEIALTPQLVADFTHHFEHIIVTHSHMTEAERHKAWNKALTATEPLVIIGPRSALFMPVRDLGLIVIDEAHEPSYKQDQSPRYSALRAATMLARAHGDVAVVLGSATPSVSDYYLAEHTKSPIITLTKPAVVSVTPPRIDLVDSRRKDYFREHRFFSDQLLQAMRQSLHKHQQVLLFHNRRGTAPTTLCSSCGWSALCTACFVPLTLHADQHKLLCHLCGRSHAVPPNCPECSHPGIVFRGMGTKLIENEIRKLFPKASIARFDADNTDDETVDRRYQDIYDGSIDIMIGTQILAKGLDVPNLSVVGVLQADNGLHLPDYQAEERVFQLLYQVAGRVGRGQHAGHVVVQTFTPDHPVITAALDRDYSSFYANQIKERQKAQFPPFTHLLKITTAYKTETGAVRAAQAKARELRSAYPELTILGPTPAFYERLHGNYRWQLLIKSKQRAQLIAIAKQLPANWRADVDPASLL